jgi:hypothetical protein
MTSGNEGSLSGLWSWGVTTALARGWNAFIYDGPGQQTMFFHHNVEFCPDWEAVITRIIDSLIGPFAKPSAYDTFTATQNRPTFSSSDVVVETTLTRKIVSGQTCLRQRPGHRRPGARHRE